MDDKGKDYFRQKKQLYDAFDNLSDDDNEADPGRSASEAAWKKVTMKPPKQQGKVIGSRTPFSRSISNSRVEMRDSPLVSDPPMASSSTDPRNQSPNKPMVPSALKKNASDLTTRTLAKAIGKRKRVSRFQMVPEEQQIFYGLHFYFFPNSDTNPARRMRIAKAKEYGATWVEDWSSAVTHVILDKSMDFSLLTRYLKFERLPDNVILVPEHYPAECISYRTLLDPKHPQFVVKGHVPPPLENAVSTKSDKLLQLKPAGRVVTARHPETPPRADEVNAPSTPAAVTNQPQAELTE